jgi:hypothetical protein
VIYWVRIRLALVNTPEVYEMVSPMQSHLLLLTGVQTQALVDEYDGQKSSGYGRMIATIHCGNDTTSHKKFSSECFQRSVIVTAVVTMAMTNPQPTPFILTVTV